MAKELGDKEVERTFREDFLGILMHDVLLSIQRRDVDDAQATRRDLIRTMFAAIEGASWEYREHVRSVAADLDSLPPLVEMALSEKTYRVAENGEIDEQVRYVSMPAMIRLTTRLAESICPGFEFDFKNDGWVNFKTSIKIRNRITHPKRTNDLEITDDEIAICQSAFFWIIHLTRYFMELTALELSHHTKHFKQFVDKLIAGDQTALAQYQAALASEQN
jgi:hypothetical protein